MRQIIVILLIFIATLPAFAQDPPPDFELTILHTSQTHAHHLPDDDNIGGVARQSTLVRQIRAENPNTLLLDVGGRFTGSIFHDVWRGGDNSQVMNALGYDMMVLGRSEFDEDDTTLGQFLGALNFPVVGSNLDAANSPDLAGKVLRIATLDIGGQTLGFVGITPLVETETSILFQDDYLNRIQDAVNGFRDRNIQIIILMSALDFETNLELAAQLPDVDILIGGGDNTMLSELYANSAGEYPLLIEGETPLLMIQAGANNRFLGRLNVVFDSDGILKSWAGEPIILYEYIPDDPEMLIVLDDLQRPVDEYLITQLRDNNGDYINLENPLRRGDCTQSECFLGSVLADAMRAETDTDIALLEVGIFAGDFNAGRVTNQQVLNFLVDNPQLVTFQMSGLDLALLMEESVSQLGTEQFLQISGLRIRYDASQPAGARLISLELETANDEFEPIDLETQYSVAISDSLLAGLSREGQSGRLLREVFVDYLKANNPLPFLFKERIIRRN